MNKIVFIDTLATGLNPEKCAIYNIGGIFCQEEHDKLKEVFRFEYRIKPFEGARITDSSLWTGGIMRMHLASYQPQDQAFEKFFNMMKEQIEIRDPKDKIYIAGFNTSQFDVPYIRNWFLRNSNQRFRDCFFVQTLDMMSISALVLKEERGAMPDFHLETTARFLDIIPRRREYYSCIDNAETCLKMYMKLKERLHLSGPMTHEESKIIKRNF